MSMRILNSWLHLSYLPTAGFCLRTKFFTTYPKGHNRAPASGLNPNVGRQLFRTISQDHFYDATKTMKSLWSFAHELLPPHPPNLASSPSLKSAITQTLIIACTEPTQQLETTLAEEGLKCEILRQKPQSNYQHYARSTLALFNHRRAWQRASQSHGLTLVLEADFVPVRGLGTLPLPFAPEDYVTMGIAWLYSCAAQVYSVSEMGHGKGFSTSMVAYIITPESAIALLDIFKQLEQTQKPTHYKAWDSELDDCLRQRGFENFIPFRNYGEHGGLPNPEHKRHGLSATHRADVLYGPLAFTPAYALAPPYRGKQTAKSSRATYEASDTYTSLTQHLRYLWVRGYARIKGLGRLIFGRFLHSKIMRESSVPIWLLHFAIRRHLSIHL